MQGHVAIKHSVSGLEDSIEVNSYHNQGCVELKSAELEAVLRTDDGVIEKIRHRTLPIIGTMWHPEREEPFMERDADMLRRLINGNN